MRILVQGPFERGLGFIESPQLEQERAEIDGGPG
jgi:hypothetical protein